jgi:hypothetical protein
MSGISMSKQSSARPSERLTMSSILLKISEEATLQSVVREWVCPLNML